MFGSSSAQSHVGDGVDLEQQLLHTKERHSEDRPRHAALPDATHNNANHRTRTDFLDGLRGIAAYLVFIQHLGTYGPLYPDYGFGQDKWDKMYFVSLPFVRVFFLGGTAAVPIFFVLSGFVLSLGPLGKLRKGDGRGTRTSLASALIRRPFRLYGPSLTICFIALLLNHCQPLMMNDGPVPFLFKDIYSFITYTISYLNPTIEHEPYVSPFYRYNTAFWTMPVELNCSIIVYLWMLLISFFASFLVSSSESKKGPTIVAGLLFCAGFLMHQTNYRWSAAAFTFGCCIAVIRTWNLESVLAIRRWSSRRNSAIFYNSCFFLGWYFLSQPTKHVTWALSTPGWRTLTSMIPKSYPDTQYVRYWETWGAVLMVYAILNLKWIQNFLLLRPIQYLGRISFMFYLVHISAIGMWGHRLKFALMPGNPASKNRYEAFWTGTFPLPEWGITGYGLRYFVWQLGTVPFVIGLAHLATRYIDEPIVRFTRIIPAKLGLK